MPIPCPKCGRQVPESLVLCSYCGSHLRPLVPCASCGQKLAPHLRSCPYCGALAAPGAPAVAVAPSASRAGIDDGLPATLACGGCRQANPSDSDRCQACGRPLAQLAAEQIRAAVSLLAEPDSADLPQEALSARRLTAQGIEELRQGRALAALARFERALLVAPADGWTLANKAAALAASGELRAALPLLLQAIAAEPANPSFVKVYAELSRLKREAVLEACGGAGGRSGALYDGDAGRLPPGRPGGTALQALSKGGSQAAYALRGAAHLFKLGLLPGPEAIATFNWHLQVPGAAEGARGEAFADLLAKDGSVFVFRHFQDAEAPAEALPYEELAAWRKLLEAGAVTRVSFCSNRPWSPQAATRIEQANAALRSAGRCPPGAEFRLEHVEPAEAR